MTALLTERRQHEQEALARELYCATCGYGIVVRRDPPLCPMCRASSWGERRASAAA